MSPFREIESPNALHALRSKEALASEILSDIAYLVDEVAPGARPIVAPLLESLVARASSLPQSGLSLVVGPEIHRWLGHAAHAARVGHANGIAHAIESLPGLLFGRVVAAGVDHGSFRLPGRRGRLRIPQAAVEFATLAQPLCAIGLAPKCIFLDGAEIQRNTVMDRIDGASNATRSLAGTRIFYHQRGDFVADMVEDLSVVASIPVAHDEGLALIPPERFDSPDVAPIVGNMAAGFRLIRTHASEHADEVEAAIDAITLVTGRRFVGGSDIFYHGVAVLNPDREWSATTYADHLVHEGAHIVLHARNELAPLLQNPDAMGAKSPIREDPRPLYGILHSTFVFLRLVQFFRRAAEPIGSDEATFRLHRHMLGFYEGMAELERCAQFTRAGESLFQGMRNAMTAFRATLPEPDPRCYQRVGKDYVV